MAGGDPGSLLCGGFCWREMSGAIGSVDKCFHGPAGSENLQGGSQSMCGVPQRGESRRASWRRGRRQVGEPPGVAAVSEDTHAVQGVYWEVLGSAKA